ncbi:MAG: ABC transporter ATP-binding protein [Neisseriales bacterium]|nr:MAG: ABC transporter ATP-binding protein [Neisseriales bacterium]
MLNIKNLTLAYGPKTLIEEANLQLYKGQITGLVGQNGTGKTSLFKLILGQNHPEAGDCDLPSDTLISYIEQEIEDVEQELVEYVLMAHNIYAEDHTDLPEYYSLRPNAEKLLMNLGFQLEELSKPLREFSGGWQMRANLAKALFCPSDLLLLDEPTNHLDIETVIWLETWLKRFQGLAIIISHDREFLDNVTNQTVHIANKQLTLYGGNYSTFERTRAEQEMQQQKNAARTQAKIAHLQSFVDRFKAKASKAKQAQSRMKMIDKLQYSPTISSQRNYSIEFYTPEYTSDLLVTLADGQIGYPDKPLINNVKLQIFANDRIGLLGKNGKGKTSLIKAIIEQTSLLSGTLEMNPKIKIGYFAQQTIDMLNVNDTPFSLISSTDKRLNQQEVYNFLGRFGFDAATSKQNVEKFSGGEKARLILASIILTKPNILFLDEPTNHLDMTMREQLAISLQDFEGAVILVSHDKFLLQSVVEDFYLIEDNRLQDFKGSLDDYQDYLLAQDPQDNLAKTKAKAKDAQPSSAAVDTFKQGTKLRHEITQAERSIDKLNQQIEKINVNLEQANQVGDSNKLIEWNNKLDKARAELSTAEEQWLILQEQLAAL